MTPLQQAADDIAYLDAHAAAFLAGKSLQDCALAGRAASENFRSSFAKEFRLPGASVSKEKQGGCTPWNVDKRLIAPWTASGPVLS